MESSPNTIKALIVDDEKHIRVFMKAVMTGLQYEVVGEAENGQYALELYKQFHPDIVLMDINMPIMDGRTCLKKIIEYNEDAIVIMLTSLSDMKTVEECIDNGASNYILKDTPLDELRKIISDTCQEYL